MDNNPQRDAETGAPDVPPHSPLPPPPQIFYTRPMTQGGVPVRPVAGAPVDPISGQPVTEGAGHGAGMAAGFTFAASLIAGAWLGNWIDTHWLHAATPWATLVMTLLGATAGFLNMSRILSRGSRPKK